MSAIDDMHHAMVNWGRWASDDDERLGVGGPPWARDYRATAAWEAGWGEQGAPETIEPPIDELAALETDALVKRLSPSVLRMMRRHYKDKRTQPEIEVQAALRQLVDMAQGSFSRNTLMVLTQ